MTLSPRLRFLLGFLLTLLAGLPASAAGPIERRPFGRAPDGEAVWAYTLTNHHGAYVTISTYGGIVVQIVVPDRAGKLGDVVLGFNRCEEYVAARGYYGAIVGRCANRIAKGTFSLDGQVYSLPLNNSPAGIPCSLHGGTVGFGQRVWRADAALFEGDPTLRLDLESADGDQGYPGRVEAQVTYSFNDRNELKISYRGTTDRPTLLSLSSHSYFNLRGNGSVLEEDLTIFAQRFTPVDAGLIPTGALQPVAGTPFDFRSAHPVGRDLAAKDLQIGYGHGYDHNWVLDHPAGLLGEAARVHDRLTGRILEIFTTEPGLQLYSGNAIDHRALVLETQHFPDSANQPAFPSVVLRPGELYASETIYRFSID